MIVQLLTEYHSEFLSLKGDCGGSSEATLVKMSNCWKSHAAAHIILLHINQKTVIILRIDTVNDRNVVILRLRKFSKKSSYNSLLIFL